MLLASYLFLSKLCFQQSGGAGTGELDAHLCPLLGPRFFVIMDGFPESDPDVQQTQPAANPPNKTIGNERAQAGVGQ